MRGGSHFGKPPFGSVGTEVGQAHPQRPHSSRKDRGKRLRPRSLQGAQIFARLRRMSPVGEGLAAIFAPPGLAHRNRLLRPLDSLTLWSSACAARAQERVLEIAGPASSEFPRFALNRTESSSRQIGPLEAEERGIPFVPVREASPL